MAQQTFTINQIRDNVASTGSHWFDWGTMQAFGTRPESKVYHGPGGVYFVTADKDYQGDTGYTVREYFPATKEIGNKTEPAQLTRAKAHKVAATLAACNGPHNPIPVGDVIIVSERFRHTTPAQQLMEDINRNGGRCTIQSARKLVSLATTHHKLMEDACNGRELYTHNGTPRQPLMTNQSNIERLAKHVGCAGVRFNGDPRGATVKLKFHNGETNDWGKEGWCVPTLGDDD